MHQIIDGDYQSSLILKPNINNGAFPFQYSYISSHAYDKNNKKSKINKQTGKNAYIRMIMIDFLIQKMCMHFFLLACSENKSGHFKNIKNYINFLFDFNLKAHESIKISIMMIV